jgi:D-lactate dehydrogenase
MQMGDYRLDHLVGFDLHGKKVGLLEPENRQRFCKNHAWFCQILACDQRKIQVNPANI